MPTVDENLAMWNSIYAWGDEEEEWSSSWPGGSKTLWYSVIFPRIHHFLPVGTILEIAPGMGRWTQYLKDVCERLVVVDLSEKCISKCRQKFASAPHISYHVNDGRSLDMIEDGSIDFVFSFDSLVHAEADALESYLKQFSKKLTPSGVGFIHHSNLKPYHDYLKYLPPKLRPIIGYQACWRARTSAEWFARCSEAAGLCCISQELVNWDTSKVFLIDAFSTLCRTGPTNSRTVKVIKNREFMNQCKCFRELAGTSREALTARGMNPTTDLRGSASRQKQSDFVRA